MKRRWTILFFIALTPLIGLSWLLSKFGGSITDAFGIGLVGMVVAVSAAGYAMIRAVPKKWPAAVALVGSLPMFKDVLRMLDFLDNAYEWFGPSFYVIFIGSIAVTVTSFVMLLLPPPKPPKDPQVAPARVVD